MRLKTVTLDMKEEISKEEIHELEAALRRFGYSDTLDVIQKEEAQRRADSIEKATAPLYAGLEENRRNIEKHQDEQARFDFERSPEGKISALAKERLSKTGETFEEAFSVLCLSHPELYEEVIQKRKERILAQAMIEKSEKARAEAIEKQSATAKIKALAAQRQLRDGGTMEECERVIRLENTQLVNDETMEAAK
jgi:hypothetical protein